MNWTDKFEHLKQLVKDYLVVDEDITMEIVIGRLLKERNKTVARLKAVRAVILRI